MSFTELCNQIFSRAIADYHLADDVDTPVSNPYDEGSIEARLYLKCWIDTVQWHLEDIIRDPDINPVEALRDSILNNITGAAVPEYTIDITRCGARGDGKRDCRKAFAKAIAKATEKRGVRIIVPAGTYFIKGPITLANHQRGICI